VKRAVLVLAAACNAPAPPVLPSASVTPHLAPRSVSPACGLDTTWQGSTTPDLSYRFSYDEHGRLAHARGTYARGYGEELADYAYDNLDHLVQLVQTRTFDSGRVEIVAHYNTLGDLLEYTWTTNRVPERYLYSDYTDTGQPTEQVVSTPAGDTRVHLEYDASNRIVRAIPDTGAPTLYSYDDDARTTTLDTDNGAVHGVFVYDARNHMLAETWTGTDPALIANEQLYAWDGDRLLSITYRSGTKTVPHELQPIGVDTYRYDCPASR
jgi:hypothetical protein